MLSSHQKAMKHRKISASSIISAFQKPAKNFFVFLRRNPDKNCTLNILFMLTVWVFSTISLHYLMVQYIIVITMIFATMSFVEVNHVR